MGTISHPPGTISFWPASGTISQPPGSITDDGFSLLSLFVAGAEGFIGSSSFPYLYATYLQAANITAYGDAVGFVKNTLPATDKFLILSGASGVYASTPDSAALSIVGDMMGNGGIAARDGTPAADTAILSKWIAAGNQRSFIFYFTTTGNLALIISKDGGAVNVVTYVSTASANFPDAGLLYARYALDVDTGASDSACTFETSPDGVTWTQLGTVVNSGGVVNIFDSTAALEIGSNNLGTAGRLAGKVYSAQLYNSAGTKVFDLTPNSYVSGSTYVCGTGQTVTLQGIAIIVPNELQFYQPTSAARPGASSWPKTGIFNLLAAGGFPSEGYGSPWSQTRCTAVNGASGILASLAPDTSNNTHLLQGPAVSVVSGLTYSMFHIFEAGAATSLQLATTSGGFDEANLWANMLLNSGTVGNKGASGVYDIRATPASLITQFPELAGSYIVMLQAVANETATGGTVIYLTSPGTPDPATRAPSFTGVATDTRFLTRSMIMLGAKTIDDYIATYQKVTSADLVEQSGVPNVSGVRADGTDDFYNSGVTAIGSSHFFAAAGQGCCIAIPLVMLPGANGIIFAKASATAANKQLQAAVDVNGMLDIFVRGGESADLETVADGLPHYLIVNLDGATATYMFDGLTETALTVGAAAEEILETFMLFARTIGTPASFGRYRLGLDELVIIDRSLTLAERQSLMQNAVNNFGVTLT